jgi:hypothetical protein
LTIPASAPHHAGQLFAKITTAIMGTPVGLCDVCARRVLGDHCDTMARMAKEESEFDKLARLIKEEGEDIR